MVGNGRILKMGRVLRGWMGVLMLLEGRGRGEAGVCWLFCTKGLIWVVARPCY